MMKINDVTTFKIPPDKTEADITIKELIDEGFEKDKSQPRHRLPILDAEGRGKYVLHRSTIDAFVAPKKRPPDVDESTLSLKDLLEDPKLKDYIVNSFMPLARSNARRCQGSSRQKSAMSRYPGYTRRNQEWNCGRLDHECDGAKCGNDLRTSEHIVVERKPLLAHKYQ